MSTENYWTRVFQRRLQRRRLLSTAGIGGLGLGAAAFVGCGSDDSDDPGTPEGQPGATATAVPTSVPPKDAKYGGTPKVVWETEPVGVFDPHVTASGFVLSNRSMVFNGFYRLDFPNITDYQPELVTTREDVQPGEFIFKVRPGVLLHDESEDVTADLLKWNLERNLTEGKAQAAGFTGSAKGLKAEVIDPETLKITFDPPSVQNIEAFISMGAGITSVVSRAQDQKMGKDFWREPVGTGPFRLTQWEQGSAITYTKWDKYWGKDSENNQLPYADGMQAIDLPDPSVRVLNLQSGQVDLAPISPSDVPTLKGDANVQIVPSGDTRLQFTLNHNKAPFNNLHLRRALNYAIDREPLAEALFGGYGRAAGGIQDNSQWYNPDFKQASFDPDKVKEELSLGGSPDGFKFSAAVLPAGVRRQLAELLQAQLLQFGIEFEILPMESVDYVARLYTTGELDGFFATNVIPGQGQVSGFEGFRDSGTRKDIKSYPELLAITDKIPLTFDVEERKQLIWDAQEMYYQTLAVQPVVVDTPQLYGLRKEWSGMGFVGAIGLAGNYAMYRQLRQA